MLRISVYRSYSSAWHRFQAIHKRNNTEYGDANNTLKILGPKRSELSSIELGLHHLHCWKGSNLEYPLNVEGCFSQSLCVPFAIFRVARLLSVYSCTTRRKRVSTCEYDCLIDVDCPSFYFMRSVTIHLQ